MAKKYEELTFHDDFMFCKVLETHQDLCRKLLELALGRKLGDLVSNSAIRRKKSFFAVREMQTIFLKKCNRFLGILRKAFPVTVSPGNWKMQ